ncbi:MAG: hypothetical protein AAB891_00605 [Patescibacteria group bacterium]
MHRHHTDLKKLEALLPSFSKGPFMVKWGRGKETEVYAGIASTITIPTPPRPTIIITCRTLYARQIGCDAGFSPIERWKTVPAPPAGLIFDWRWFYEQPSQHRLKLVAPRHDRCWLCSHTNSILRELFSEALVTMFLEECVEDEPLGKRLRDRFLLMF